MTAPLHGHSELVDAFSALGAWSGSVHWATLSPETRDRLALLLFDALAVATGGAGLPEHRELARRWPSAPGSATTLGAVSGPADRAAWLNGTAAVALELDSANRTSRGHAAAQTWFACLALGEELAAPAADLLDALVIAHETASRFGRASVLADGLHPHGNWGTAGAAAGAARLLRLGPHGVAGAIDAAGGLALAPPFAAAIAGHPVRNHWAGFTNAAGLVAARLTAPETPLVGVAADAYDCALGSLDPAVLVDGLDGTLPAGDGLALQTDFFKRHAACGYTHAALDAVFEVRDQEGWPADTAEIAGILVETTAPGLGLAGIRRSTRLAAMFSLDHLVAAVALLGRSGPEISGADVRADDRVLDLARRVTVRVGDDLQARMPEDRGARVSVRLADGRTLTAEVPNARWDPRFHPATWADVRGKAERLLAPLGHDARVLEEWVRALAAAGLSSAHIPPLSPVFG